jgi:hypothetical protein
MLKPSTVATPVGGLLLLRDRAGLRREAAKLRLLSEAAGGAGMPTRVTRWEVTDASRLRSAIRASGTLREYLTRRGEMR